MNQFRAWYYAQPPALRALLTINVVFYVVWLLVLIHIDVTARFVVGHIALNPGLPGILFEPWQLITYNFLHLGNTLGGMLHILFNMLWLVWIGREYEEMHGSHRMMAIYLLGGLGGGLLTVLLHALFPDASFFGGPIHGASASVLALMTAVAIMYPYKRIGLLFIGNVRLIHIVLAFLALDLLFLSSGGTAVGAHLGGALMGFLFAKAEGQGVDLSSWAQVFFGHRRKRGYGHSRGEEGVLQRMESWLGGRSDKKNTPSREANSAPPRERAQPKPASDIDNEVDRILEKISAQGYDALTPEEKRILYEASQK